MIEPTVIGLLLRKPTEIVRVNLRHEHFSEPFCALAFMAMRQCVTEGLTPDVVTVALHMPDNPVADLAALWQETAVGTADNLPHLCGLIRQQARSRNIAALLSKAQEALVAGKNADAIRSRLITRLADLDDDERLYTHTGKAWMGEVVDYLTAASEASQNGGLMGVPSGIAGLDNIMGGFHRSDLIVVGARPKIGKTAWMMSAACRAAASGKRVGIISAEMPAYQLGLRLVAMMADINNAKLRACNLDDPEYTRLHAATLRASEMPLMIYDRPACSPADIAIQARAWTLSGGLDLLFVDYLTRLNPDERTDNRTREVGHMIASLKTVARSLDIPVVCLAQLSRKLEDRKDKRPMLSDLRDSGEIEQEADVVMFLYRDSVYNQDANPYDAEILVEANRHGPPGMIRCGFKAEQMQWVNYGD